MRCRRERPLPFALLPAALLLCCAALAADLDGDGADDLVFRDLASDSKQLLVLAGGQARHIELAPPEDRWQGVEVRLGDFDGDRRSELLTRNLHTGATALRNAGTAPDHGVRPVDGLRPDPGQLIEAVADFDGDGRDDLLLRDRESARRGIYRMRGAAVDTAHSGTLDFASGPRQRFVAAGDFDGDGRADLLLRHETTLVWTLHLLDGPKALLSAELRLPLGTLWSLQGSADMDGDGRQDLLFRRLDTGGWWLWFMNGARLRTISGPVALPSDAAWRLAALADLDGDGNGDALLRHHDSGQLYVAYLIQRGLRADSGPVAVGEDTSRQVAGTADVDGNGAADVLLTTGEENWQLLELSTAGSPWVRALATGDSTALSLACAPPVYADFTLPPPTEPAGADSALLSWSRPTTRSNGEALCAQDLAGFRISAWRQGSGVYREVEVGDSAQRRNLLAALPPGIWRFGIRAYDAQGRVGPFSEIRSKTIRRSTGAP